MKIFSALSFFSVASAGECTAASNKNKPSFCAVVTHHITKTNSWVCKNCFNLRVNFNLNWLGAVGNAFDNTDSVYLAFAGPVSFVKSAGPTNDVKAIGQDEHGSFVYEVGFNDQAQFGDRRIDFNIGKFHRG